MMTFRSSVPELLGTGVEADFRRKIMAYYNFMRDGNRTWLEPVETIYEGQPKEIPVPVGVDLSDAPKVLVCKVDDCGAMFRKANMASMHFGKKHADLKEDKDSWREYSEEMSLV